MADWISSNIAIAILELIQSATLRVLVQIFMEKKKYFIFRPFRFNTTETESDKATDIAYSFYLLILFIVEIKEFLCERNIK